jgi:hypothetical protein
LSRLRRLRTSRRRCTRLSAVTGAGPSKRRNARATMRATKHAGVAAIKPEVASRPVGVGVNFASPPRLRSVALYISVGSWDR